MAEFIENRPISCNSCGYGPIFGQESKMNVRDKILLECRWICPRCGSVVRIDEAEINEESSD